VHCGGQIKDAMLLQHFHVLQKVHCWVARMDVCKDIINALQLFLIIGIFVTLKVECICPLEGSRSHGAITLLFGKCTLRFRSPRVIDHRWEVNVIMDDGWYELTPTEGMQVLPYVSCKHHWNGVCWVDLLKNK
jgi:hypothetical protein